MRKVPFLFAPASDHSLNLNQFNVCSKICWACFLQAVQDLNTCDRQVSYLQPSGGFYCESQTPSVRRSHSFAALLLFLFILYVSNQVLCSVLWQVKLRTHLIAASFAAWSWHGQHTVDYQLWISIHYSGFFPSWRWRAFKGVAILNLFLGWCLDLNAAWGGLRKGGYVGARLVLPGRSRWTWKKLYPLRWVLHEKHFSEF